MTGELKPIKPTCLSHQLKSAFLCVLCALCGKTKPIQHTGAHPVTGEH